MGSASCQYATQECCFEGLLACTASQLWFVPCDIISQHQQINSNKENVRQQLRNTFDLAKNVYKNEGILGFYRGFILSMITFGPQSMLFWHIFGSARESLSKYHYIKERQNAHIGKFPRDKILSKRQIGVWKPTYNTWSKQVISRVISGNIICVNECIYDSIGYDTSSVSTQHEEIIGKRCYQRTLVK